MSTQSKQLFTLQTESIYSIIARASWSILLMTVILGLLYPLLMTDLARVLFPRQAEGSLVVLDNKIVGSSLIGQDFSKTPYFQSRPSATSTPYDASASSGTNFGSSHEKLSQQVAERVRYWQKETQSEERVPVDLLTSSSSGLDPHISVDAARYQVPVVARKTGISAEALNKMIEAHTEKGMFGGPEFVNVLKLNLDVRKQHLSTD